MTTTTERTEPGVGPRVVVMGVSAVGKSSVSAELSRCTGVPWQDGDDLHPAANIEKMTGGLPLTDEDRAPWLDEVGAVLAGAQPGTGVIIACSALRRVYRDRLRAAAPGTVFIHLTGEHELLARRTGSRSGHFMPGALLHSQLAILEPLGADEDGQVIDVAASVVDIAAQAADWIGHRGI